MLNCKDISYLASKKLDQKLTLAERLGFLLHLSMCRLCRHYVRDVKYLHRFMHHARDNSRALLADSVKLSESARLRIKKVLQQVQSEDSD